MKNIFFTILIFFTIPIYAKEKSILTEIQINSKSSLQISKLMLNHLAVYPTKDYTETNILKDFVKINQNLKGIGAKSVKSFLFSELYKVFFNFDQNDLIDSKNIHISGANLKAVQVKLNEHKEVLTPFAVFIINDMLKNYEQFQKDNYINNYLNTSDIKYDKPILKKRIKLLNRHVGPWLMLFTRHDSKKFNQLCSKYIKNYFKTISYLSKYFHFQKINEEGLDIFSHKSLPLAEIIQKLEANEIIPNDAPQEKSSPQKDIKNITVDPGAGAAPKIDEIINKLDQKQQ